MPKNVCTRKKGLIATGMEGFSEPCVVYSNEIEMEKITSLLPPHHSRLLFCIHSKTVFYFVFTACTIYVCYIYFIFRREKNVLLFRPLPRGCNSERYICIQTNKYNNKNKKNTTVTCIRCTHTKRNGRQ